MTVDSTLLRPELTLPSAEADALREAYAKAQVILEYGSGGSTLLAAEMPGKQVFAVESDRVWVDRLQTWSDAHPPARNSSVDIMWCDIGPTKEWGHPKGMDDYLHFASHPLAVRDRADFVQPHVVLVDGRFRAGCAMAAAFRGTAPVKVLIDDYLRRRHYHRVERFFGRARNVRTHCVLSRRAAPHTCRRPRTDNRNDDTALTVWISFERTEKC